ncbi:hypothetical protein [Metabacillus sp. SLBN-84]
MKKILWWVSTAACLLLISRHVGLSFVNEYYWWVASVFIAALLGQFLFSAAEKRKTPAK